MSEERSDHQGTNLDEFIQHLTAAQTSLRAYVLASLGNLTDASDVLQKTNLALWKNASKFRADCEFMPWAVTIAKYEILSYCRDKNRDRHVYPADIAELMLETANKVMVDPVGRQEALHRCLEKLPRKHDEILQMRYFDERSISQIAKALHRTDDSVKSVLIRIRKKLRDCIENRMKSSAT